MHGAKAQDSSHRCVLIKKTKQKPFSPGLWPTDMNLIATTAATQIQWEGGRSCYEEDASFLV